MDEYHIKYKCVCGYEIIKNLLVTITLCKVCEKIKNKNKWIKNKNKNKNKISIKIKIKIK